MIKDTAINSEWADVAIIYDRYFMANLNDYKVVRDISKLNPGKPVDYFLFNPDIDKELYLLSQKVGSSNVDALYFKIKDMALSQCGPNVDFIISELRKANGNN